MNVYLHVYGEMEGERACVFYIYDGSSFLSQLLGFPLGREPLYCVFILTRVTLCG